MSSKESDRAKKTLFVKGIREEVTDQDLIEFFSAIGPVKSAFCVGSRGDNADISNNNKDDSGRPADDSKKTRKSPFKVGFVHFSLADDASTALKELNGKKLRGHPISLELAKHRHRSSKDAVDEKEADITIEDNPIESPAVAEKDTSATPQKPIDLEKIKANRVLVRTVLISGLPAELEKKQLYKKVRKYGNVSNIDFPFRVPSAQNNGAADQDGIIVDGMAAVLYETVKDAQNAVKHLEGHTFKGVEISACIYPHVSKAKMNYRLVIRNLSFTAKAQDLLKTFLQFGPIIEFTLPLRLDSQVNKGFCFVTYGSLECANKAIEKMSAGQSVDGSSRVMIADFAKSKSQFLEESKSVVETPEIPEKHESDEDDIDSDKEHTEEDMKDEDENDEDIDEVIEMDSDEETEEIAEESPVKPDSERFKSADPSEGTTVFIRNLSFETTDEDLKEKFSEYGKVVYARVVMDRDTQRPKGTGFVQYLNRDDVDTLLSKHAAPQSLQISSTLPLESSNSIFLNGRPLFIFRALPKDNLKDEESKYPSSIRPQSEQDKRNMYLLKEALVNPTDEIYAHLSATFLDGINNVIQTNKKKLMKEMHFFVSRTRLSFRHLGKSVDDKILRAVCTEAITKFQKKIGSAPQSTEKQKSEYKGWKDEGLFHKIRIKQAKILKDKKSSKSLGFGFVEFDNHAHALACLRFLKTDTECKIENGPTLTKRWYVEFAIENSVILKKRDARQKAGKDNTKGFKPTSPAQKDGKTAKKTSGVKDGQVSKSGKKPAERKSPTPTTKPTQKKPAPKAFTDSNARPASKITENTPKKQEKNRKRKREETRDEFDDMVSKYRMKLESL